MNRTFRLLFVFVLFCSVLSPLRAEENVWRKVALDGVHIVSLVSDPVRPSTLYAVTSRGLKKSLDSGATWADLGAALPGGILPSSLAVSQLNSKELYLGFEGGGIFKSLDGGSTWQASNEGLPNLYVRCIVISPKDPNLLYIGIQDGVAFSADGGKRWHMTSGFKRAVNVNCIAIDPKNPQFMYAGTGGAGVFKSGNGGVSWVDRNQGLSSLSILALHIDPENPDIVLAGAYHPATPTDVYVGDANGGAFRTVDGGRTWEETELLTTTIFSFASDARYSGLIYAGAWGGAYRSEDGGATWKDINVGLENPFLHTMRMMPARPPVLLAGTTFGLLSYTDTQAEGLSRPGGDSPFVLYAIAAGAALILAGLLLFLRRRRKTANDPRRPVW
ncbi:MAG: LPXTG cell wall anchor domain-containing protein [Desulfovibrio sp.]|nr:LPXTG cell wall anchor domain-containing protein [Desulfovibrio sp.]